MIQFYYKQISFCLITFVFVYYVYINLYVKDLKDLELKTPNTKPKVLPNTTKTILYWGTVFGKTDFGFGLGTEIFKTCEIKSCFATNNKSYFPVDQFDAILFHGTQYSIEKDGVPQKRSKHQKYIFYAMESFFNVNFEQKCNSDFYNWTMTFKRDADVYQPYGRVIKYKTGYQMPTKKYLRSKQKLVAWFVSNCYTPGALKRFRYVKELQKHIPVDIYGTCGPLKCPRSNTKQCYEMLEQNYKFYLSFENTFCEDYVTEKVFNILKLNIVPIVFNFVDYNALFPEHSLIVAHKFINPKHLAKFLLNLSKNDTEYLKFFEWKKWYSINTDFNLCNLCKKLHEPTEYSSYDNVMDWYRGYFCLS